ncbi:hypothetical protein BDW42DRAFT_45560 [Aspergillus taichungensis]|uniref:Uncharacterized protein n=1 Tax=Aspergillus taichungensis TaxID=482145 RepID=A0A2J5I3N9_9EURO|nr:hypothetical protein BDW42DRAFT_45560 [Aspergillus taichungensis]
MSKFRSEHKKSVRSLVSEDPWRADTPFGPPRITSFPGGGGIRRIRNTLSKLSPAARAEREVLRQKNRTKVPLTERNVDTFVTSQQVTAVYHPQSDSPEVQVTAWLERVSN